MIWVMASPLGELLRCQPYAGAKTHIKDFGLGQGPNVVMSLCEEYGLAPGTIVYADNLFVSMDLLEHMSDRQLGVTGTMRMNRLAGIPLPSKNQAMKELKRGEAKAVYTADMMVCVWKDNKPVYMASNVDELEPMGTCQRYSREQRKYMSVSQPSINKAYNASMGGVDLLDNSEKNYVIATRVKKWYWNLYPWFLNISMVQAWRLYRAHMAHRHKMAAVDLEEEETEAEKKRRRIEEKKKEEIPLVEFIRQVVATSFKKHSDPNRPKQQLQTGLAKATLSEIRFDNGRHMITKTETRGVCKLCKGRSQFRCRRCEVALHPECFEPFHTA